MVHCFLPGKKLRSFNEHLHWPFVNIFYSFLVWTSKSILELYLLFSSPCGGALWDWWLVPLLSRAILNTSTDSISKSVETRGQVLLTSLHFWNYLIFHTTKYIIELCKINTNITIMFLLNFIKIYPIYLFRLVYSLKL